MPFDPRLYVIDPETGDIKPKARKTLGQYLSQTTSMSAELGQATSTTILGGAVRTGPDEYTYSPPAPNAFPVSPNASETDGGAITDPSSNGQQTFTRLQDDMQRFTYDKTVTGDPTLTNTDRQRALYDIDSSSSGDQETNSSSTNPVTRRIIERQSAVLRNNRFSAANERNFTSERNPVRGSSSSPLTLGTSQNDSEKKLYKEMRDAGLKSLLRAAGVTPREDNVIDTPAFNALITGESLLGGLSKVPVEDMRAPVARADTIPTSGEPSTRRLAFLGNEIDDIGPEDDNDVREPQYNDKSYGNLNTYLSPFGGAFPTSMILNMIVLLIVTLAAVAAVSALFSLLVRASERVDFAHGEVGELGRERNGDSVGDGDKVRQFFTDFLGLCQPYSDTYVELAIRGAIGYTGLPEDIVRKGAKVSLGEIGESALSLLGSSGYYVVMSRNVVRNLELLGSAAQDIGRAFSGTFSGTGDGVAGIEGLATFIDTLRKSKLVRFVDTLARLGNSEDYRILNSKKIADMRPEPNAIGELNYRIPGNPSLRVSRSRVRTNERTLSWSFMEAAKNGAYLLPDSVLKARYLYSQEGKDPKQLIESALGPTDPGSEKFRISPEKVKQIEGRLDAEYVPFYMQDLRTNEILNFHAFIDDLQDSYTANYNQVEAYGRMDPVQIYKNTTRSISMTFMVVATSKEDFDAMWFTINRLTMMVYPEWSKGTELSGKSDNDQFSFIQPFSQIPTSSPVIRLRVGDLIRSNYSRFNLARIFGLGSQSSENKGYFLTSSGSKLELSSSVTPNTKLTFNGWSGEVNGYIEDPEAGGLLSAVVGSYPRSYRINLQQGAELKDSVAKKSPDPKTEKVYELANPITISVPSSLGNSAEEDQNINNLTIKFVKLPHTAVRKEEQFSGKFSGNAKVLEKFSENSIVRSFEHAGGKGLAGVITSLSYIWYDDNTTWEIDDGSKAPMMCKVSIQFNPIHDIPMGLDADGFMRAPAYPVGRLVNGLFASTGSF